MIPYTGYICLISSRATIIKVEGIPKWIILKLDPSFTNHFPNPCSYFPKETSWLLHTAMTDTCYPSCPTHIWCLIDLLGCCLLTTMNERLPILGLGWTFMNYFCLMFFDMMLAGTPFNLNTFSTANTFANWFYFHWPHLLFYQVKSSWFDQYCLLFCEMPEVHGVSDTAKMERKTQDFGLEDWIEVNERLGTLAYQIDRKGAFVTLHRVPSSHWDCLFFQLWSVHELSMCFLDHL